MKPFALQRATDRAAAIAAAAASSTAQQGASVRFLAGGTTLIDLMKLGVEQPEQVDRHQAPGSRWRSGASGRQPAHRRIRHQ